MRRHGYGSGYPQRSSCGDYRAGWHLGLAGAIGRVAMRRRIRARIVQDDLDHSMIGEQTEGSRRRLSVRQRATDADCGSHQVWHDVKNMSAVPALPLNLPERRYCCAAPGPLAVAAGHGSDSLTLLKSARGHQATSRSASERLGTARPRACLDRIAAPCASSTALHAGIWSWLILSFAPKISPRPSKAAMCR